jgi:hypothetical protein
VVDRLGLSQGDFYPQVNQASLADAGFYPHILVRLLAQNRPIFIRIDLRHLAKIWQILSELKSGAFGYFQGSCVAVAPVAPIVVVEMLDDVQVT